MNELERKTDELISLWLEEFRYRPPAYQKSPLSGDLALTETRNHRNRAVMLQRDETGELVTVARMRVAAKETRQTARPTIDIDRDAERMEKIMVKLKAVNDPAYQALVLNYEGNSYREIAGKMNCSASYAQRYKETAFNMVMMEVAELR
jgi:hypothetical protein